MSIYETSDESPSRPLASFRELFPGVQSLAMRFPLGGLCTPRYRRATLAPALTNPDEASASLEGPLFFGWEDSAERLDMRLGGDVNFNRFIRPRERYRFRDSA